jgi:hypothetical protein
VNCNGGNLQALRKNGREGSLEISGTKAMNCSGGNLQARPTEKITHTHNDASFLSKLRRRRKKKKKKKSPRFYRNYAGEGKKKLAPFLP